MGCTQSIEKKPTIRNSRSSFSLYKQNNYKAYLQHYFLSTLPIEPVLRENTKTIVETSWKVILNTVFESDTEKIKGPTLLFNKVYSLLFLSTDSFEEFFPNINAQSNVLWKVIKFITSIDIQKESKSIKRIQALGTHHCTHIKNIRPAQYAVYANAILVGVNHVLKLEENSEVMREWFHTFSFIFKHMLPYAIPPEKINPTEALIVVPNKKKKLTSKVKRITYAASATNTPQSKRSLLPLFQRKQEINQVPAILPNQADERKSESKNQESLNL